MSYVSGPLATPHVAFTESTDGGATWVAPRAIETAGDRGFYAAPAISPNGRDVYVVYNAFTTPFQPTTGTLRSLVGVVLHADTGGTAPTGAFCPVHRGATGDPRSSTANALTDEFLGDYVYAAGDAHVRRGRLERRRNAADCPAIDACRQALQNGRALRRRRRAVLRRRVRQLGHLRRHVSRSDAVGRHDRRGRGRRPFSS